MSEKYQQGQNDGDYYSEESSSQSEDNEDYDNSESDNTENEENEESDVLPEWACAYCQNSDPTAVAQCMVCKKWFCNSHCRDGSHIVQHLIYSDHRSIRLHPEGLQKDFSGSPICCFNNPSHTNVFNLGTIRSTNGYYSIICRDQCLDKPRLKEIGWDADSWSHIIKDKHFVSFLLNDKECTGRNVVKVSHSDIRALETLWKKNINATIDDLNKEDEDEFALEPVPSFFGTARAYSNIFLPLIKCESDSDKEDNDSKCIESVNLRWINGPGNDKIVAFHTNTYDRRYRMNIGQLLIFHLPIALLNMNQEITFEGEVIHVEDTEVRARVLPSDNLPLGHTSNYYITFVWYGTSFDRMRKAVQALSNSSSMSDNLYNSLMGNSVKPYYFNTIPIASFSIPGQPELNDSQVRAVQAALRNELTLIQGPPGTVTSATIVYHLVRTYRQKVLVCSPSNVATDNLALKINRLGLNVVRVVAKTRETVSSQVEHLCLHNLVMYVGGNNNELSRLNKELLETGQLKPSDRDRYTKLTSIAENLLLSRCEVVCCTCCSAMDGRLASMNFKTVLIDEATQAREPECLIPIVKGCERLILVGDHQQLGPVILNQPAKRAGFSISLFERLLSLSNIPYRLNVQYRMHPALSEFPSNIFYEGDLQNGIHASERTRNFNFPWPRSDKPMMFWAVSGSEECGPNGYSLLNRTEANYVETVVTRLLACNMQGSRIGVITPYDQQRSLLTQMFNQHSNKENDEYKQVEVASVDEFQGREKDYIIFSCVRANTNGTLGFLTDYRRLNVALTRAKYGIIIIGDPVTLKHDGLWLSLLSYYQKEKCLVTGASLDSLSPYIIYLDDNNKQYINRRQFALAKRLKEQTKSYIGPDSSIFFGVNSAAEGNTESNPVKNIHSSFVDTDNDFYSPIQDLMNDDTGI